MIAASWERRAETLVRTADLAVRSQTLMRRTIALRDEMAVQVKALRLSLTGLRTDTGENAELLPLAEAIRTIAAETASLAVARTELDAALPSMPRPQITQTETVTLSQTSWTIPLQLLGNVFHPLERPPVSFRYFYR